MPDTHVSVNLPERYKVVRHVANGGMASVWAAEDSVLGRQVAVKLLAEHVAAEPLSRTRFEREARTAARVSNHPNVVTIYDVGEEGGRPFIVMELFTGGSVADRLRGRQPIPFTQAVQWLRETAAALDYAHGEGIVHRDVKPANLLLDERGRVAVGDFGIARLADDTSLTQAGQVLGTAAYLSPEQAMGQSATDASDRYSLGIVAFELLTGRRPFEGEHVAAQARQHVEDDPPSTGLGREVDDVIARAMAKDPDARYFTAGQFVDELQQAVRRADGPRTASTRVAPAAPPAPTPASRRLDPVAAAAPPSRPAPPERRAADGGRRNGWLLLAALGAIALIVAAVAIAGLSGGDGGSGGDERASTQPKPTATTKKKKPKTSTSTQPQQTATQEAPAQTAPPATTTTTTTQQQQQATPAGNPSALNDQGYAKLQAGDAAGAIPLLQQSVSGFEQQGSNANPTTYGYALYNLGDALMQAGRPSEAIPYFERRLQVSPDDRPQLVKQRIKEAKKAAKD